MDNRVILFLGLAAMLLVAALFIQSYGDLSDIPEQPVVISYNSATTEYKTVAANGTLVYTLTDLSTSIQNCIDYLPRPLDIELRLYGRHNLTSRILIYGGNVQISGVQWSSTNTRGTSLYYTGGWTPRGILHINVTHSTATVAAGVDYYTLKALKLVAGTVGCYATVATSGAGISHLEIYDVQAYTFNGSDYGFYLGSGQCYVLSRLYAQNFSRGFSLESWNYFNTINDIYTLSCATGVLFTTCDGINVYGISSLQSTLYDGITLTSCNYLNFYGIKAVSNRNHGIRLNGCSYINIYGAVVTDNSQQTNNSYSGIMIQSQGGTYSLHNTITGGSIISTGTTKMHQYAVREADANQNYNLVSGVSYGGCGTDDISLQGANSIETDCR